jgi:malic enzyme
MQLHLVSPLQQLNANFIIPSVFDPEVAKKVAAAVKGAAK